MMQCIEKITGKIIISSYNLFIEDIEDMSELEYWENRLDYLNEPYAITFRLKNDKIYYNLYCNDNRAGSRFKCSEVK